MGIKLHVFERFEEVTGDIFEIFEKTLIAHMTVGLIY
jgi:hypothetical protein